MTKRCITAILCPPIRRRYGTRTERPPGSTAVPRGGSAVTSELIIRRGILVSTGFPGRAAGDPRISIIDLAILISNTRLRCVEAAGANKQRSRVSRRISKFPPNARNRRSRVTPSNSPRTDVFVCLIRVGLPSGVRDCEGRELAETRRLDPGEVLGRRELPALAILRAERRGMLAEILDAARPRQSHLRRRRRCHMHQPILETDSHGKRRGKRFSLPLRGKMWSIDLGFFLSCLSTRSFR